MSLQQEAWAETIDPNIDAIGARKLSGLSTAVSSILFAALVFAVGEATAKTHHANSNGGEILAAPISLRQSPYDSHEGIDSGGYCNDAGCYIWANPLDPTTGGGGGGGGGSGGTGSSSGGSGPPPDHRPFRS